ncbi:MAG TPA: alpha/beta hydrolase [Terriglobales bacterium]|nr:alpha/beta hydrolase [Terriglobales bacterium]
MNQVTNSHVRVQTGYVTIEGDEIYYEVRGQGQPLLMIAGGGGDAGFFSIAANILSDEYKVITYDRRGNSRSTRNIPQNFEISQQSRDAVAVLKAAGETSAFVFGNSGGAVIALDMAMTQPQAVQAAIVHEPPITPVHPDAKKWKRFFANVYWLGLVFGAQIAMLKFALPSGIPTSAYRSVPNDVTTRMGKNHDFFVKHEMLPFSNYHPDIEAIKRNGVKIFMAAGQMTLDKHKFYGETALILADLLDGEMVVFPGNHLSYLDRPDQWAAVLRRVLHQAV